MSWAVLCIYLGSVRGGKSSRNPGSTSLSVSHFFFFFKEGKLRPGDMCHFFHGHRIKVVAQS